MDAAHPRRIRTSGGWFPLAPRTLVRLQGSDATRYLNGQLTIDIRRLPANVARRACLLTAKGKICAPVFVWPVRDGEYLLEGPAELREEILARLERYIIADDVTVSDCSEEPPGFHVLGSDPPSGAVSIPRLGQPGYDESVAPSDLDEMTPEERELLRIENLVPAWGAEISADSLVQEVRLEESAVDFDKGCYVGQEVVSRLKSVGRVNRRLHAFESADAPPAGSFRLRSETFDGPEAGWITSLARDFELARTVALGYLHRTFEDGTTFVATDSAGHPAGTFAKRPS